MNWKWNYRKRSLLKRGIGLILWIGGFVAIQFLLKSVISSLIFRTHNFSSALQDQLIVFMRMVVLLVYLFVLAIHTLFSDNNMDRIYTWMGPKEKSMFKSIIEEEEEEPKEESRPSVSEILTRGKDKK